MSHAIVDASSVATPKPGVLKLSKDTKLTCGRTPWGYSSNAHSEDRCGARAAFKVVSTCNCGKCDMSQVLCEEHVKEG